MKENGGKGKMVANTEMVLYEGIKCIPVYKKGSDTVLLKNPDTNVIYKVDKEKTSLDMLKASNILMTSIISKVGHIPNLEKPFLYKSVDNEEEFEDGIKFSVTGTDNQILETEKWYLFKNKSNNKLCVIIPEETQNIDNVTSATIVYNEGMGDFTINLEFVASNDENWIRKVNKGQDMNISYMYIPQEGHGFNKEVLEFTSSDPDEAWEQYVQYFDYYSFSALEEISPFGRIYNTDIKDYNAENWKFVAHDKFNKILQTNDLTIYEKNKRCKAEVENDVRSSISKLAAVTLDKFINEALLKIRVTKGFIEAKSLLAKANLDQLIEYYKNTAEFAQKEYNWIKDEDNTASFKDFVGNGGFEEQIVKLQSQLQQSETNNNSTQQRQTQIPAPQRGAVPQRQRSRSADNKGTESPPPVSVKPNVQEQTVTIVVRNGDTKNTYVFSTDTESNECKLISINERPASHNTAAFIGDFCDAHNVINNTKSYQIALREYNNYMEQQKPRAKPAGKSSWRNTDDDLDEMFKKMGL